MLKFKSTNDPWCEHCGDLLLGTLIAFKDGTWWCPACCFVNGDITWEQLKEVYDR